MSFSIIILICWFLITLNKNPHAQCPTTLCIGNRLINQGILHASLHLINKSKLRCSQGTRDRVWKLSIDLTGAFSKYLGLYMVWADMRGCCMALMHVASCNSTCYWNISSRPKITFLCYPMGSKYWPIWPHWKLKMPQKNIPEYFKM